MFQPSPDNPEIEAVYRDTRVVRKPISGIVSGYHEIPYILITGGESNRQSVRISGTIYVSPRFILSPNQLPDTYADLFDPETIDSTLHGRFFSFAWSRKKNVKVENSHFTITSLEGEPEQHVDEAHDRLCMQEDVRTGLVAGPKFHFYPVSLDKFISEIVDREFRM